jgi:hypothetical protein
MTWEKPVKDGVAAVQASLAKVRPAIASSKAPQAKLAQAQLMLNQAQDILDTIAKDGSNGVHAPAYTLARVNEAKLLASGATALASGREAKLSRK